jgi:hypothetical protein
MNEIETSKFSNRFEQLLKLMRSDNFLSLKGVGNEIPFYICPFDVKETIEMYKVISDLVQKLKPIKVLELDLYHICLKIIEKRGNLKGIIEQESTSNKSNLLEYLENTLDPKDHIIPEIKEIIEGSDHHILFMKGIGEVFPYMHLNMVLENLQNISHKKPSVFFFPGRYYFDDSYGSTLKLFNLINNKYYRAFNIYHCTG